MHQLVVISTFEASRKLKYGYFLFVCTVKMHQCTVICHFGLKNKLTVISNSDGLAAEGLVVSGELLLRLGRVGRPEHDPGGRVADSVSVDSLNENLEHHIFYSY